MLFPERNDINYSWCAVWQNRAGGTNGIHNAEGSERCLRESDGPFDVMYVQRRNGTKGESPLRSV